MDDKKELIPLLAETVWHDISVDDRVLSDSYKIFNFFMNLLEEYNCKPKKILEVGVNDRITIHYLSEYFSADAFGLDVGYEK